MRVLLLWVYVYGGSHGGFRLGGVVLESWYGYWSLTSRQVDLDCWVGGRFGGCSRMGVLCICS